MAVWFSIEVLDGALSASIWSEAHGDQLIETALLGGARDWSWHRHTWGVVLELAFDDDEAWERFCAATIVRAALDAVPDPLTGLIMYRGRGGSAGACSPRRPKPLTGAGSAALPLPWSLWEDRATTIFAIPGDRWHRAPEVGVGAR